MIIASVKIRLCGDKNKKNLAKNQTGAREKKYLKRFFFLFTISIRFVILIISDLIINKEDNIKTARTPDDKSV